jgi:carboxypeptidase D
MYVPYIADAMFNANDTENYNISSIMIYDPSISYGALTTSVVAPAFAEYWQNLLGLNETFMGYIRNMSDSCGYTKYMEESLVFPPKGPIPTPPNVDGSDDSCDAWDAVFYAASYVNPCFDEYQVATTCPLLWDVLGFPGSFDYLPDGAQVYFNRTAVQKAINAPVGEWMECTNVDVFPNGDGSLPSALTVLPKVIERADRVVIGQGQLDMVVMTNGTLITIQNMTWNGAQGFSSPPAGFGNFYVPYHAEYDNELGSTAGMGDMGLTHTERGLTFVQVQLSGHMVPQYAPSAAYRQLEFLLGRIPSLTTVSPFTTYPNTSG